MSCHYFLAIPHTNYVEEWDFHPLATLPAGHHSQGGEYKGQEHIHRGVADPRLLAIPASRGRVAALDPN